MDKVLFSLTVIVTGLGFGWAVRMAVDAGRLRLPVELPRLRVTLQKTALLWVLPLTYCGAIWNLSLKNVELAAMPFVGASVFLMGGFLALGAARILKLDARQTGAFYCCGSFTNIGAASNEMTVRGSDAIIGQTPLTSSRRPEQDPSASPRHPRNLDQLGQMHKNTRPTKNGDFPLPYAVANSSAIALAPARSFLPVPSFGISSTA